MTTEPHTDSGRRPGLPIDAWARQFDGWGCTTLLHDVTLADELRLDMPVPARVRGLLGKHHRALRCSTGATSCHGCELLGSCPWPALFERSEEENRLRSTQPFWLQTGTFERRARAGTELRARVGLVAPMAHEAAWLGVALRDAMDTLAGCTTPSSLPAIGEQRVRLGQPAERWTVTLRTPAQIKGDPRRAREDCPQAPILPAIMRAAVRRLHGLATWTPELQLDRVAWPDLRQVHAESYEIRPARGTRYSFRQGQNVPLQGWVGSFTVAGDAMTALSPLLDLIRTVGVGSGTTAGMGEISCARVETEAADEESS